MVRSENESTPAVQSAKLHREQLRIALSALEDAISAAAFGREQEWFRGVSDRLHDVAKAWDDHIRVTESAEGLFEEIRDREPRLAVKLDRLITDHVEMRKIIADQLAELVSSDPAKIDDFREQLLGTLGKLARHRQRGADVLYEAYWGDVGGQG
ncbi:MAG: hypothetical protein WDA27_09135 [Actinomycetota bacterium]